MTLENIRSIRSGYTKVQHSEIISAYLFDNLSIEQISETHETGELDIHIILSSYRIHILGGKRTNDIHDIESIAKYENRDRALIQYIDLFYTKDLADTSPLPFIIKFKQEAEDAQRQKETLDNRITQAKTIVRKKKRNAAPIITKISALIILLSFIIILPVYIYKTNNISMKNPDSTLYSYEFSEGNYSGQGRDEPLGIGRLITPEYEYIGQFYNGLKRGGGCYIFKDFPIYFGEYHNDRMNGLGIETLSDKTNIMISMRANNRKEGLALEVNGDIMELIEYKNGEKDFVVAVGNFEDSSINIKNSEYDIIFSNGLYKLGRRIDFETGNGFITEWNGSGEDRVISFIEYIDGEVNKAVTYSVKKISFATKDYIIEVDDSSVICSETNGYKNLQGISLQYDYNAKDKPSYFSKVENGSITMLGTFLKSGNMNL